LPRALTRRALEDRIEEFADGREIAPPDGWHGAKGAGGEATSKLLGVSKQRAHQLAGKGQDENGTGRTVRMFVPSWF